VKPGHDCDPAVVYLVPRDALWVCGSWLNYPVQIVPVSISSRLVSVAVVVSAVG
jgi:hypothetical protein